MAYPITLMSIALSALLLVSSCGLTQKCPVGSEGCECTPGGACDPGLDCYSSLCVANDSAGNNGQSANNGNHGNNGGPSGETNSGGSSEGTNGTNGSSTTKGPGVMCPYYDESATAPLAEGGPGAAQEVELTFYPSGALETINGLDCGPIENPYGDASPGTSTDCFDSYECDGCEIWLGRRLLENGNMGWYVVDMSLGLGETKCPDLEGFYPWETACKPQCDGRECGSDECGGTCGSPCSGNLYCSQDTYACECPDGCQQGSVCCGGAFCADDCIGTPCCT